MKVLFLTIGDISSIRNHEIYSDLLREFVKNGHEVYAVCAREKRNNLPTEMTEEDGVKLLRVRIGNITKTNLIEKGISTVCIRNQYIHAINSYYANVKFDLVLYSTPPVTLCGIVRDIKKRDHAKSYLMLKDIFPQNAIDIGILKEKGIKGLIYRYFRFVEKKLYEISDNIGCMSEANVEYLLQHNPEIQPNKVGICPNCIEIQDICIDDAEKERIRRKYGIPADKKVFIYGGNLGKPQGIPFLIDCLQNQLDNENAYFLIVGNGTEYLKLETFFSNAKPNNMKLIKWLPKEEFDRLTASCDVGLIFLDYRFSIPNFPSRLLSYMQVKLPILIATDSNTDMGKVAEEGNFGFWCESSYVDNFSKQVDRMLNADLKSMGLNAYKYLCGHYDVKYAYECIMEKQN